MIDQTTIEDYKRKDVILTQAQTGIIYWVLAALADLEGVTRPLFESCVSSNKSQRQINKQIATAAASAQKKLTALEAVIDTQSFNNAPAPAARSKLALWALATALSTAALADNVAPAVVYDSPLKESKDLEAAIASAVWSIAALATEVGVNVEEALKKHPFGPEGPPF